MSAVVVNGKVVHYEVLGRGPPIVFLHGWLGSWRYWIPTMQAMSTRYRTYAVDLWGFGDTSNAPERYTLDAQVELIDSFLEHLGVVRVALVGHALGGVIALHFAARFPDFTARVMAINTPLSTVAITQRFQSTPLNGLLDWLVDRDPESEVITTESSKTDETVIPASLAAIEETDLRAELAGIQAPFLFVHGEKDPAIALPQEDMLKDATSNSVHHITFEDARHFPMLDSTPQFNRLLLDFLEAGDDLETLTLKEEWKRRMR